MKCITATIKNGKMYMKYSKSKGCKKQVESAQDVLDSIKSRKIIVK